jgi:hypothetical protein
MLSAKKATEIARKFLAESYSDLPTTTFAMPRQYLEAEHARVFEACYADATLCEEFVLLIFRVKDDGSIDFREDRRAIVRQLLKQKGTFLPDVTTPVEHILAHFERAIHEKDAELPEWIVGIEMVQAGDFDAVATIKHPNEREHIRVQILLFRKRSERKKFFKHESLDSSKMITLIIPHAMKPVDVRAALAQQLLTFRQAFQRIVN